MEELSVKTLLEAGIHYGHRASRWNPKMKPYIYAKRKLIHILDIRESIRGLVTAATFVEKIVAQGRDVVFVGTKRQARVAVRAIAEQTGMHFVTERWIGGTLTNFRVIRSRVSRLEELEELEEGGQIDRFSKKEGATLRRDLRKIKRNLDGVRRMNRLPGALIIIDPHRERIAVREANLAGVATVALADTNCDPDTVDVLIPGNDDAMRAVQVVLERLGQAVAAGLAKRGTVAAMPAAPRPEASAEQPETPSEAARQAAPGPAPAGRTPQAVRTRRQGRGRGRGTSRHQQSRAPRAPSTDEGAKTEGSETPAPAAPSDETQAEGSGSEPES